MSSDNINYVELTPTQHVKQAPDMYFGDTTNKKITTYTYDHTNVKTEEIVISMLLLKMFDELLMNCVDNSLRKPAMTYIKIEQVKRKLSLINDGFTIPIKKFNNTESYVPEVIFSRLFTSSNYSTVTQGAGKNGVGASVVNIFSKLFIIDIVNNNISYIQQFENGTDIINKPVISKTVSKNYVKITFEPTLTDVTDIIFDNTIRCLQRRLMDVKVLNTKLDIFWNDVAYKNCTLLSYSKILFKSDNMLYISTTNYNVCILIDCENKKFNAISFANNIHTNDNGIHIDNFIDSFHKQLVSYKTKFNTLTKLTLKKCIKILMSTTVTTPKFDSQSKQRLTACDNSKNIFILQPDDFKKITKAFDMNQIVDGKIIETKAKTTRKQFLMIDKLEDAEKAGTKHSKMCTLMLCEGDSASTLAKIGMSKIGRIHYGVYPLGGKPINVINGSNDKVFNEKGKVNSLIQILGLPKRDYKQKKFGELDVAKMRYGKIVMLKDADSDGAHIMGLVLNIFSNIYPELLKIDGFFNEFITPMLKISIPTNLFGKLEKQIRNVNKSSGTIVKSKNNVIYPFYNMIEYNNTVRSIPELCKIKPVYVKGLAGHNKFEVEEYFNGTNYGNNIIEIHSDDKADDNIIKAFDKKYTDERKKWLMTLTDDTYLPRIIHQSICISDFINNDLLSYEYDNCVRSLPSVVDGLKPSQRKVLYTCFEKNMKPARSNTDDNKDGAFKKIFQICGIVADFAYYHHGDASLNGTIIGMSQDYPGANNLPLLAYSGSTGSREQNGGDAGQPRYVGASVHEVSRYIFPKIDDCLLEKAIEDNQEVEPKYYVPIIPILLINGSKGIGTGYACNILQFSQYDIINYMLLTLKCKAPCEIHPYVNGFKGNIINDKDNKYTISGIYNVSGNMLTITEIPYTISKCDYRDILKEYFNNSFIDSYSEGKVEDINNVNFTIKLKPDYDVDNLVKDFKLCDTVSQNIVCFDKDSKIKIYDNIYDVIEEWFEVRKQLYERRNLMIIDDYKQRLSILMNKSRFIKSIIEKQIIIEKIKKDVLVSKLETLKFDKKDDTYDYLTSMHIYMLTEEEYIKLTENYNKLLQEYNIYITSTSIYDIWYNEILELQKYIIS